jgi:hypothetical protein
LISPLTGDDQTQIISMQTIGEFVDGCGARRGVILQEIFLDRCSQPRREQAGIQAPRIRRPGQEALGSRQNQSIHLLLVFAQTEFSISRRLALCYHDLSALMRSPAHQFDEKPALWLPLKAAV